MMFLRLLPQPELQPLPLFSSMPATYHVARNLVDGDLNVSDEDGPGGNWEVHRRTPSDTVIRRARNRDGRPSTIEVVEGNVHSPEERRGWVVISITGTPGRRRRCCEL